MKRLFPVLTAVGLFLAFSGNAQAQDPLRYEMMQKHLVDQPAQLRITAGESLKNVNVNITNCGQSTVQKKIASLGAGQSDVVSWKQAPGKYSCNVHITANAAAGVINVNNVHEFLSISPISLSVDLRALSPDVSDIMLHGSAPFTKASIAVTAEDGSQIDSVSTEFNSTKEYKLSWTPNEKSPALLEIKIEDNNGSWATNTIFYFQIPHTDIVFDTKASEIRADQTQYLQESLDKIQEILERHQQVAVDLYITGHTDTVGSASDNDKLSLKRARAIASWFKQHGLAIATYYRGAGERGLAVATPDNTPEEKNRRAVYILSNRPPVESVSLGKWTKI